MTFVTRVLLALVTLAIPSVAFAADAVALSSAVFVERQLIDNSGRSRVELHAPQVVTPGDRLVFILSYRNTGEKPATHFTVTNPLPQAVAYAGTPDEDALISVDGGRTWGRLSTQRIREDDGRWRSARPDDVTHIRWTLAQPLRAGATGKLSFRGTVR
jgi:uncharacterized repeat protein (TIGR01451 family)